MKRQFRPARGAQADAVADRLAAGRAQRRQRHVERERASAAAQSARRETCVSATGAVGSMACRGNARSCLQSVPDVSQTTARPSSTAPCCARARQRARALGAGDLPARPGRRRAGRAAAPRCCASSIVAVDLGTPHRRGAPRAGRERQGRDHRCRRAGRGAARCDVRASPPTRRRLPFAAGSLDLVVSALALQFVNDLPGTLIQIRRALKPDGLLLAALIGGDTPDRTARSLRRRRKPRSKAALSPRVAPFADLRDLGALLQRAGFALPVTDVDRAHRALRLAVRADARPARAWARPMCWSSAGARRSPRDAAARWREIYARALCRCRRPHPRDLRDRLAVGLGAA